MTSSDYAAGLRFAARTHDFIGQLRNTGNDPGNPHWYPAEHALAELLTRLIRDPQEVPAAIIAAMDEYDQLVKEKARQDEYFRNQQDQQDQFYAELHAETVRHHELAVTVACPYCGAKPGDPCQSAGPNGRGYSKGIHDHKDRYRAAEHLTGQERN